MPRPNLTVSARWFGTDIGFPHAASFGISNGISNTVRPTAIDNQLHSPSHIANAPVKTHVVSSFAWERMVTAVEKARQRLRRAAEVLEEAGIPYAVAEGNAVAAWVSEVDEAAVRNTQDVDILLRRTDLSRAAQALAAAGFVHRHVSRIDMFLDGPDAKARDSVHIIFAAEKVRQEHMLPAPDVEESKPTSTFSVLSIDSLVRMKLTSFRDKDRTHLRDLIDVGLVDSTWLSRLPSKLAERLEELLSNPEC